MWVYSELKLSENLPSVDCSVIPAHPWIYNLGQQTNNGLYLSPINAVSYLSQQLVSVGDVSDIIIFLIAGGNYDDFMQGMVNFADVLPMPAITQIKRLAQSAAELANEKMLIPSASSVLPSAMPFSTPTTRAALNGQRMKDAQSGASEALSIEQLKLSLAGFVQERAAKLGEMAAELEALKSKSAKVWAFTGQGDIATTLYYLMKDIPAASAVHCAAVMLLGDNLDSIRGMIHEFDPDAGS